MYILKVKGQKGKWVKRNKYIEEEKLFSLLARLFKPIKQDKYHRE